MLLKLYLLFGLIGIGWAVTLQADHVRDLQVYAVEQGSAPWGHWGPVPERYSSWQSHSNRLIPVYTFGMDLSAVAGEKSVYRHAGALERLFGELPQDTLNPSADYFDQTDVYRLQKMAADAGKKYIVLVIFDGMDWQTAWAAATVRAGKVAYREGRGTGLRFQDYRGTGTDFGYFVTSPHDEGTVVDMDTQHIVQPGTLLGGYSPHLAGRTPWSSPGGDRGYIIGTGTKTQHAYTDSASSATSMTSGVKTYNDAINVDIHGNQARPISQELQHRGYRIGVVTSVPISHATPAAAYANNVHRDDYQDLARDLLGLKSISHPDEPLPGVNVLIGSGWGEQFATDRGQGDNYVAGNRYLTSADCEAAEAKGFTFVQRTEGQAGDELLRDAAHRAVQGDSHRLLGFFGVKGGHLPFQTADGKFNPAPSVQKSGEGFLTPSQAEVYSEADVRENPTLAEMTTAALTVLGSEEQPFWLMVESGDVDWANHQNNIDNSIGAVLSGDDAFQVITDWIEAHHAWNDAAVIVTSDHGHYLVLDRPDMLLGK